METQLEPVIVEFIRYNNWANTQIFAICQTLSADQLAAAAPGAYGTIRDTLRHLVHAEADYVARLNGKPFKWEDQPNLAGLAAVAGQAAAGLLEAVQRIPPTHMVHEEEGSLTLDYQARVLFMQAIEHGIEHRTNITTILNGLGIPSPELYLWGYMWTQQEEFKVKEGTK
jgi:uncharacterized damage-inducible protein DinB